MNSPPLECSSLSSEMLPGSGREEDIDEALAPVGGTKDLGNGQIPGAEHLVPVGFSNRD